VPNLKTTPGEVGDFRSLEEAVIDRPSRLALGRHLSFVIDDVSIQMAAVMHMGRSITVEDASKVYLPQNPETPAHLDNFIANTIDGYMNNFGGIFPKISLSVSGNRTAFRSFLIPVLGKKELDAAIRFEAKKQIPFPADDCIYDYRITDKIVKNKRSLYRIALNASTKRHIEQPLQIFRDRDIDVSHVYHAEDVLGQLLPRLKNFDPNKNYALLCVTRGLLEISFYRGSNLEFFHCSRLGSSLLSDLVENTQRAFFTESLLADIRTAFDFYSGQQTESVTNRVHVYGDLSYTVELLDSLESNVQYEFVRFPVEELDFVKTRDDSVRMNLAVCLPALAAASCQTKMASLLPEEIKKKRLLREQNLFGKISVSVLAIVLLMVWATLFHQTKREEDSLAILNHQVVDFKNSDAYHTYNNLKYQIAGDQTYVDLAKKKQTHLNLNLKELSLLTPKPIKLLHFSFIPADPGQNLTIQGVAASNNIPPEIILAEYVEGLDSSPFFDDVRLIRHVKKADGKGFMIDFTISMVGVA